METEKLLIDKSKVYQLACAGCTRHGETLGECNYDEPCERLIFAFTVAEPVDAVEAPDKEILKAIKILIKQYEHSKQSDYVRNPIAHAFSHMEAVGRKRLRRKEKGITMKPMYAWEMEPVFIFTGIVILLVAVGIGILLSKVLERGEQKRKVDEDPCDKCLRWPECNGVDEACPVRKPGGK